MKASKQISESLPIMILLTLSGGFMDAYSYLCRGEVFANAQTGNILLFGVNLSMGHWSKALQYVCPVLAFAIGIAAAEFVRRKFTNRKHVHWRQIIVFLRGSDIIRRNVYTAGTEFACKQSYIACVRCTG